MIYLNTLWDWHWLNTIGIMIAVLGTLYWASNLLDSKYYIVKQLTKIFTLGITISVILGFGNILINIIGGFIYYHLSSYPSTQNIPYTILIADGAAINYTTLLGN